VSPLSREVDGFSPLLGTSILFNAVFLLPSPFAPSHPPAAMYRLFGKAKPAAPAAPPPDIDGHVGRLNAKVPELDAKIAAIDREVMELKRKLAATRAPSQQTAIKQQAMTLLRRKKMYEGQRGSYQTRAFNMEQTQFALGMVRDAQEQATAVKFMAGQLKEEQGKVREREREGGGAREAREARTRRRGARPRAHRTRRPGMGPRPACCYRLTPHPAPNPAQIDLDALEDAQLDMEDLLADAEEINEVRRRVMMMMRRAGTERRGGRRAATPPSAPNPTLTPFPPSPSPLPPIQIMSRDYNVGAAVNEDDLNAEFAALDGELDAIPDVAPGVGAGAGAEAAGTASWGAAAAGGVPASAMPAGGGGYAPTGIEAELQGLMGGGGGGGGGGGFPSVPAAASAQRAPALAGSASMYGR
jgi:hypothetical protein